MAGKLNLYSPAVAALLAGCKKEEPQSSAEPSESIFPTAEEPVDSPEPGEEAVTGRIGFVLMGMGEFFQGLADAYTEGFTAAGWDCDWVSGEFDPTVQIEAIENYTAMGVDVLIVHPVSGAAVSAAVDTARDAGVKVIIMVDPTEHWDGLLASDNKATGMANAWMCAEFVEEHWPDAEARSIPVALITNTSSYDSTQQSEGLATIEDYSDKLYIAETYELSGQNVEDGMKAAENLYTSHPEITLFVTTSNTVAQGFNNYYTAINSPVEDLSDYGVWGTNSSLEALESIKETREGEGMFRGVNIQCSYTETVYYMLLLATGLLDGSYDQQAFPANVYLVNTDNVGDWLETEHVDLQWDYENACGVQVNG